MPEAAASKHLHVIKTSAELYQGACHLVIQVSLRPGDVAWHDFLESGRAAGPAPTHVADANEVSNILFSSGTTGQPGPRACRAGYSAALILSLCSPACIKTTRIMQGRLAAAAAAVMGPLAFDMGSGVDVGAQVLYALARCCGACIAAMFLHHDCAWCSGVHACATLAAQHG